MPIEINKVYCCDSKDGMQELINQGIKVDLIITDPPYDMPCMKPGGKSRIADRLRKEMNELEEAKLHLGISNDYLELMVKLQDKINIYIWCNGKQIEQYLDFFVKKHKCKYDILIWNKTNAMPCYSNKYLTDKEYVLYFRKGGLCNPRCYEDAKTVYQSSLNAIDKKRYGHPTIKPLPFIIKMVKNSSMEGDLILDPFAGSGTTLVASKILDRNFIGFEIEQKYVDICNQRLQEKELTIKESSKK